MKSSISHQPRTGLKEGVQRFFNYWQRTKGAATYEKFLSKYPVKSYRRGTVLFSEDDIPKSVFIVKEGIVKAYLLTKKGEIKPSGLHMAGDVFPLAWVFDRSEKSIYYFDAFTDVKVTIVPKEEYTRFLFNNQEALAYNFRRMVDRYLAAMLRVGILEYSKASEKVIHRLHYLCLYYGHDLKKNVVEINLPLTQQELANSMGLTRETTGIELKKLERKGIMFRKNGKYVVRTDKLGALLDEEYDLKSTVHESLADLH